MRTYARKKPEYQFIEGVQDLCRLCLEEYTSSVKIFPDDTDTDICGPLSLRIMICVGLEITREECLPNAICLECYKELEKYYTFRKKCEMTYQKLKSHILALREREHQKIIEMKNEAETVIIDKLEQEEQNVQQLVLSYNENNQDELVNVINGIQIGNLQESNGFTTGTLKQISIEEQQNNETQVQDLSVTNAVSKVDELNSSMSMILSSILIELGVLQQQEDGQLVVVDKNLKTVELEGEDNSKVVLEIVEEDEKDSTVTNVIEEENNSNEKAEQNKSSSKKKDISIDEKDERTCSTCGKRFVSRSCLIRHQRVHSGERPFACGVCGKRFTQREIRTRHEHIHKAKRPFPCEQCPKSFTQRSALIAHARSHAPKHSRALALHRCAFCTKVFLYPSGLSRHMIVHTGKVFVCNTCGRHFSDKSSLLRHLRRSHRSESPPPDGSKDQSKILWIKPSLDKPLKSD